jgi:DNA (cytosine-5)-methyltransferase 1
VIFQTSSVRRRRIGHREAPTVIELFSGAGLLGWAFKKEGCSILQSYECDAVAAATCRKNVCLNVEVADLARYKPVGKCDILLAGPPCQGFSSIGQRTHDDPRNSLALVIPRWARQTGAKIVVVENVPPFLKSPAWKKLSDQMERRGYEPTVWTLNARHFAVPQNRVRSFTVFSQLGTPKPPKTSPTTVTVREALDNLPPFPEDTIQHVARPQTDFAMKRIRLVPPGGDIRDIAKCRPDLVPASWFKTGGKIIDIWGRIPWDDVSNTLRTGFLHPSRGRFLHPEEDRPISFREAARLQTVPDSFHFEGLPGQICRQLGNGVPLGMGRAVAKSVLATLT